MDNNTIILKSDAIDAACDAADEYVDATMESLIRRLMNEYDDILSVGDGIIKRLKAMRKEEINNGN